MSILFSVVLVGALVNERNKRFLESWESGSEGELVDDVQENMRPGFKLDPQRTMSQYFNVLLSALVGKKIFGCSCGRWKEMQIEQRA